MRSGLSALTALVPRIAGSELSPRCHLSTPVPLLCSFSWGTHQPVPSGQDVEGMGRARASNVKYSLPLDSQERIYWEKSPGRRIERTGAMAL